MHVCLTFSKLAIPAAFKETKTFISHVCMQINSSFTPLSLMCGNYANSE